MTVDSVLTTDAFEYRVVCDVDCDVQKKVCKRKDTIQ